MITSEEQAIDIAEGRRFEREYTAQKPLLTQWQRKPPNGKERGMVRYNKGK